jgi:hypothetical protein
MDFTDISHFSCFSEDKSYSEDGWFAYDPIKDYERMGVGTTNTAWRISCINNNYEVPLIKNSFAPLIQQCLRFLQK